MTKLIAVYTPQMVSRRTWGQIAEFTRSAATDFAPRNVGEARWVLGDIARITAWAVDVAGERLDRAVVFNGRQIDYYIKNGYVSRGTKDREVTQRRLHRIAAELSQGTPARRVRPVRIVHDRVGPYSEKELTGFRARGIGLSTDLQRHVWLTVMTLACGAGMTSSEIFHARHEHVTVTNTGTVIQITGPQARTVAVAEDWEGDMRLVISSPLVHDYLLADTTQREKTDPGTAIHTMLARSAKNLGAFTIERLRMTWIVARLEAGATPKQMMAALNIQTLSTIEKAVKYLAEPEAHELFAQLRKAAS